MRKPVTLLLAAGFLAAGCQAPQESRTWETVRRVRVDDPNVENRSEAYAQKLHRILHREGVPHKVVTYEFRFKTQLRPMTTATRTAVIYRDDATPRNPWWLMDDSMHKPLWVPNTEPRRQVSFYLRRPANVVELRDYSGESRGKAVAEFEPGRREPTRRLAHRRDEAEPVASYERPAAGWTRPIAAVLRTVHKGLMTVPRFLGFRRDD